MSVGQLSDCVGDPFLSVSCHVMSCHVTFHTLKSALILAPFVPVISGHGVGARVCAQCMRPFFFGIVMAHASVIL